MQMVGWLNTVGWVVEHRWWVVELNAGGWLNASGWWWWVAEHRWWCRKWVFADGGSGGLVEERRWWLNVVGLCGEHHLEVNNGWWELSAEVEGLVYEKNKEI